MLQWRFQLLGKVIQNISYIQTYYKRPLFANSGKYTEPAPSFNNAGKSSDVTRV